MKQFFGMSQRGNLEEALQGLHSPQFIMLLSNDFQFEAHVKALEQRFPGVPSIGCIGMSYQVKVIENGVSVIAFSDGVSAAANVLEQVSTMPVRYIHRLEQDVQAVGGSGRDTVLIELLRRKRRLRADHDLHRSAETGHLSGGGDRRQGKGLRQRTDLRGRGGLRPGAQPRRTHQDL